MSTRASEFVRVARLWRAIDAIGGGLMQRHYRGLDMAVRYEAELLIGAGC